MKHRMISVFLAFALLLALLPRAYAYPTAGVMEGSNIQWNLNAATGVLTISGTGEMPYTFTTPPWYPHRGEIKKAFVQEGVTNLGDMAFYACNALTEVELPNSLRMIKELAFSGCTSLKEIRLPGNLTYIGSSAFQGCSALERIEIPGSVKKLSGKIFGACRALKEITLNEGLEFIGDCTFQYSPIREITIPSTVKHIGISAFEGCTSLKKVVFNEGLEELCCRAFCDTGLRDVTLPASLRSIHAESFLFSGLQRAVVRSNTCKYYRGSANASPFGSALVYAHLNSTTYDCWQNNAFFTFQPLYFQDVMPDAWYFTAVRFAKENELFAGVGTDRFAPNSPMTRAMVVTVLWRYAEKLGLDTAASGTSDFEDVPSGKWYTKAVAWANDKGVVNGVGDGKFLPDGLVTREQLVTILFRFAKLLGDSTDARAELQSYADANQVKSYAQDAFGWAVAAEVVNGVSVSGTSTLQPKGSATRGQVAAILMRYIQNVRSAEHPEIYVYAKAAELPMLTRAAEAYGKLHPELRIHVARAGSRDFGQNYLYDGKRDLFLISSDLLGQFNQGYYNKHVTSTQLWFDEFRFVAAKDDPLGIGGPAGLLERLRAGSIRFGVQSGSMDLVDCTRQSLLALGATEEEISAFQTISYSNSVKLAEAVASGVVDAAMVRISDARANGLTVFEAVDTGNFYAKGLTYAAVLPYPNPDPSTYQRATMEPGAAQTAAAAAFAAWLSKAGLP